MVPREQNRFIPTPAKLRIAPKVQAPTGHPELSGKLAAQRLHPQMPSHHSPGQKTGRENGMS